MSDFEDEQKEKGLHYCGIKVKEYDEDMLHGTAIDYCFERDKDLTLWVSNSEYGSQVNFCPICGYEGKIKLNLDKIRK